MKITEIIVESAGQGDCFHVAGRRMIKDPDSQNLTLVHAMVTGDSGKRFPHAWIEKNGTVYDDSNGNHYVMPVEKYYKAAKVNAKDKGEYATYSDEQAMKNMARNKHWGPWDLDYQIDEMALASYNTLGDFNKPGAFKQKVDKRLVTNPTNQLKTAKFFEKTPYDFRLFFSNISGTGKYAETGPRAPDWFEDKFGPEATAQIVNGSEDAITVVFVGNSGADRRMLTPWLMAHRFGHAIQAGARGFTSRRDNPWSMAESHFFKEVNSVLQMYQRTANGSGWSDIDYNLTAEYNALFNSIGTQRSSRTGQIKRPYEFFYELFAQYLKDGHVTLNPLPVSLGYGKQAWGKHTKYMSLQPEDRDELSRQQVSDRLAADLGYMFSDVLDSCVGKIYVM